MNAEGHKRWYRLVPAAYSLALAAIVLGPLLGSGYLLLRDAVSTPRSYLTDSALGLGEAAPRAVPQDALLATLSTVVDGGIIVKAILLAALWLAGWGAAVLARELLRVSLGPQLVAATVAVWNPYVAERLLQGHWSLLTGYAALPWIALLAARLRAAPPSGTAGTWAALIGCLAAAGLTPTGSLLAGGLAVVLVGKRNLPATVTFWILTTMPWVIATALSGTGAAPSDPAGIPAFAARAEPWLGTLGSLAGLGGIWNSTAVPESRTTFFALIGTALLVILVATGVRAVRGSGRVARRLVWLAVAAIVLPALGATGWGLSVGEFLVTRVPGAGLLRDTQKYVALAMPAYALCAAAGCRVVGRWLSANVFDGPGARPDRARTGGAAVLFIALLLIALPDLAWGVGGALRPVHYPQGWQRVAELADGPGDIAVLPGGMFRKFGYSGSAPVLDPAPRMLRRDALQTGELPVRGGVVTGESKQARRVEKLLLRGASAHELATQGVGWVLVEGDTPGPLGDSKNTLAQLSSVYSDADLQLYRVPGTITVDDASPADRHLSGAAHLLWATLLVGGFLTAAAYSRRTVGEGSVLGETEGEAESDHDDAHQRDDENDPHI